MRIWDKICTITRQALTGKDNQTIDMGRISWACSYVAVVAHDIAKPGTLQELAIALSAVTAAHGIALGLKAATEPSPIGAEALIAGANPRSVENPNPAIQPAADGGGQVDPGCKSEGAC